MIFKYSEGVISIDDNGLVKVIGNMIDYVDKLYLNDNDKIMSESNIPLFKSKGLLICSVLELVNLKKIIVIHNHEEYINKRFNIIELLQYIPDYEIMYEKGVEYELV